MEEEDQEELELQLLPSQRSLLASSSYSSSQHVPSRPPPPDSSSSTLLGGPSVDLQLSISLKPIHHPPPPNCAFTGPACDFGNTGSVEALKWQAAEQIRLAAVEKAYAERVRELTKREMELAQSEFARARHMWQRAREEVDKAERMKERATRHTDSTCMEITCQSCRQKFKP